MRLSCFGILRPRNTSAAAAPTFRPVVESLEGREVPALIRGAHLLGSALVSHPSGTVVHPAATVVALGGQVSGTWSAQATLGGSVQTLRGGGTVSPIGAAQARGTLTINGSVATGTFILSNARGTLTVRVTGTAPVPNGGPAAMTYTVLGGTGAFANDRGSGVAHLKETPEVRPAPPPPGSFGPLWVRAATFALTFG